MSAPFHPGPLPPRHPDDASLRHHKTPSRARSARLLPPHDACLPIALHSPRALSQINPHGVPSDPNQLLQRRARRNQGDHSSRTSPPMDFAPPRCGDTTHLGSIARTRLRRRKQATPTNNSPVPLFLRFSDNRTCSLSNALCVFPNTAYCTGAIPQIARVAPHIETSHAPLRRADPMKPGFLSSGAMLSP
jgi:hypothetical protein